MLRPLKSPYTETGSHGFWFWGRKLRTLRGGELTSSGQGKKALAQGNAGRLFSFEVIELLKIQRSGGSIC